MSQQNHIEYILKASSSNGTNSLFKQRISSTVLGPLLVEVQCNIEQY